MKMWDTVLTNWLVTCYYTCFAIITQIQKKSREASNFRRPVLPHLLKITIFQHSVFNIRHSCATGNRLHPVLSYQDYHLT